MSTTNDDKNHHLNKIGENVIRVLLSELMAEKSREEGRRITYEEVSKATGIHRTTLTKIADPRGHNVRTDIIDKLCSYFKVPVEKILVHIPDANPET